MRINRITLVLFLFVAALGCQEENQQDNTGTSSAVDASTGQVDIPSQPNSDVKPQVDPVASFMKLVDLVPSQLEKTWWKKSSDYAGGNVTKNGNNINLVKKFDDGSGQVIHRARLHNHDFDFSSNSGWISISEDTTISSGSYFNREFRCTFYFANGNWKIMKVEWGQVRNKPLNLVQMKTTKQSDLLQFFEGLLQTAANSK